MAFDKRRIAVCDDSLKDIDYLSSVVYESCGSLGITCQLEKYTDPRRLLEAFASGESFDCIFLDMIIGEDNGIDVGYKLRGKGYDNAIVIVSVSPSFALQGYDLRAFSYLLKPVSVIDITRIFNELFLTQEMGSLLIKIHNSMVNVPIEAIHYLESYGRVIDIVTENEKLSTYSRLIDFEKQLDAFYFVRCHKSFIVNLRKIKKITSQEIMMSSGVDIPIGRAYKTDLRNRFLLYLQNSSV